MLDDTLDIDEAADTLRFMRVDPDATSIYDLTPTPVSYVSSSPRHRHQLRDTRENVLRLREALAEGWDIGPELAHEERRLAALEAAA